MMDMDYESAIRSNQVSLVQCIIPSILVNILIEDGAITDEEAEEIRSRGTRRDQSRAILDFICCRGEAGYTSLLLGLHACGQHAIFHRLAKLIPPSEPPNLKAKLKACNRTKLVSLQDDFLNEGQLKDFYVWPTFKLLVWRFTNWTFSPITLDEALNQRDKVRIVLKGPQWSGKSTVAAWIVDQWIKETGPLSAFNIVLFIQDAVLKDVPDSIKGSFNLIEYVLKEAGQELSKIELSWIKLSKSIIVYDTNEEGEQGNVQTILNGNFHDNCSLFVTSSESIDNKSSFWKNIDYRIIIAKYDWSSLIDYSLRLFGAEDIVKRFRRSVEEASLVKYVKYPVHISTLAEVWWWNNQAFARSKATTYSQINYVALRQSKLNKFLPCGESDMFPWQVLKSQGFNIGQCPQLPQLAMWAKFDDICLLREQGMKSSWLNQQVIFPTVKRSNEFFEFTMCIKINWECQMIQDFLAAKYMSELCLGELGFSALVSMKCNNISELQKFILGMLIDYKRVSDVENAFLISCENLTTATGMMLAFQQAFRFCFSMLISWRDTQTLTYPGFVTENHDQGLKHFSLMEELICECCNQAQIGSGKDGRLNYLLECREGALKELKRLIGFFEKSQDSREEIIRHFVQDLSAKNMICYVDSGMEAIKEKLQAPTKITCPLPFCDESVCGRLMSFLTWIKDLALSYVVRKKVKNG